MKRACLLFALACPTPAFADNEVEAAPAGEGAEANEPEGEAPESRFVLDIDSSLAAKRSSTPQASPAILTVAETEQVLDDGLLTLSSYLDSIPGFDFLPAYWLRSPAARGIAGSVNMLVDGVSVTSPIDYRYSAGLGLFLEEFDRIEAISGPAGVLWGAHSFLGVVNAVSGVAPRPTTTVRSGLGNRDFARVAARTEQPLGGGMLRLFAGFATQRNPELRLDSQFENVPPYSDSGTWEGGSDTYVSEPSQNVYGTVAARYASEHWQAYLRLPMSRESYEVSELGGGLSPGQYGSRENFDPTAFVTFQTAALDGRLALMTRAVWNLFAERFDRSLFDGVSSRQEVVMSTFKAVAETSFRYQYEFVRTNLMAGLEGESIVPHDSRFYQTDPVLSGGLNYRGPVLEESSSQSLSMYAFDETHLWERLSIAGGARRNSSDSYQSVSLYQANAGVRLLGESYAKVGLTQGMRPPTLISRFGLQPVRGRTDLRPERSEALQFEVNGSTSFAPWLTKAFARVDYVQTSTDSALILEGLTNASYAYQPVETGALSIETIEAELRLELAGRVRLDVMYRTNRVEQERFAREPAQAPNHGYEQRWWGRIAAGDPGWLAVGANVSGGCGGKSLYAGGAPAEDSSFDRITTVESDLGCYYLLGGSVTVGVAEGVSAQLLVENALDERPPSAMYQFPELFGAEAKQPTLMGRQVLVQLRWSPLTEGEL
jgi:hypothetical protein